MNVKPYPKGMEVKLFKESIHHGFFDYYGFCTTL